MTSDYVRLRNLQLALARELGMSPSARLAIKANGKRSDFDLAAAMSQSGDEEVFGGEEETSS